MQKLILLTILLIIIGVQSCRDRSEPNREDSNKEASTSENNIYPLLRGDYPDPSIVLVKDTFYMTHSTFDYYPGLLVWKSTDLVNWQPVSRALTKVVGSVYAPDITYHDGDFYIYFPAGGENYVVKAASASGPWSEPQSLGIGHIDPGHIVTPSGQRYVMVSGSRLAPLNNQGTKVTGELEKVYDGWPIPPEWNIECFCLEGPKLFYKDPYYYQTVAEGGTAGPSTSHLVAMARAKDLFGPWENSPYNPIIHTYSRHQKWWSTGHGTPFEDKNGNWWMIYHGYEKHFLTLGRQTLLSPLKWTEDEWLVVDSAVQPENKLPKKTNPVDLSDDFNGSDLGWQWAFYKEFNKDRFRVEDGRLTLQGTGNDVGNSNPLAIVPMHHSYELTVEVEVTDAAEGGLILFYNEDFFSGIGFSEGQFYRLRRGEKRNIKQSPDRTKTHLKVINDHHEVTMFTSNDGEKWEKMPFAIETSGYHHNMLGGFLALRAALYATGSGEVKFDNFRYEPLSKE